MYRNVALAMVVSLWALPAAAVNVTVDFEAVVDGFLTSFPSIPTAALASPPPPAASSSEATIPIGGPVIGFPTDPGPSLGDVVTGSVSVEIDGRDAVMNVSGRAPIAGADPRLVSATVSGIDRVEACTAADPCVSTGPLPQFLIPVEQTTARGTLSAKYEPNVTFTSPTFDSSVSWLDLAILVGAPLDGQPTPPSFFELIQLPGALPLKVDYTRVDRGMIAVPGLEPDSCAFFSCTLVSATVTSGAIRIDGEPAPIPVPMSLAALVVALGALGSLRILRFVERDSRRN